MKGNGEHPLTANAIQKLPFSVRCSAFRDVFCIYCESGLNLLCRLTLPDEAEAHSEDGVWEADWDSDNEANKDAGTSRCHNSTSQKRACCLPGLHAHLI